MPLVPSSDPGNRERQVHSHRFPAANTAVAYVNQDDEQLDAHREIPEVRLHLGGYLRRVAGEGQRHGQMPPRAAERAAQAMPTFAVGEEAEQAGNAMIREVGRWPRRSTLRRRSFEPGSTARVDVVVRTRKIGHFFPGGTVDAFDVWLELQAQDARRPRHLLERQRGGRRQGPGGDRARIFIASYQLDGEGNPINKRNAWQARSVLYVRLIPPGAADVAHYRVKIPKDAKGPITFTAKLNYRKFSCYYTQFAYAGAAQAGPGSDAAERDLQQPGLQLSIRTTFRQMFPARSRAAFPICRSSPWRRAHGDGSARATPQWTPVVRKQDRERWNDWGIGLLLQGDLKGAEYAFKRVTEAEPGYADGWLNVARALIQEGETEAAKPYRREGAGHRSGAGPRAISSRPWSQKTDGDYDGALRVARDSARAQYPRDRVALNQIGAHSVSEAGIREALEALDAVCDVDPEDVQMHYTLMLCYRGLGRREAQRGGGAVPALQGGRSRRRPSPPSRALLSPEDNNERQPIHDHESVALPECQ